MAEPLEYPVSAPGFDALLDQLRLGEVYAKAFDAAMAKVSPILKMAADGAKTLQQQTEVLVASIAKQSDAEKKRVKQAEDTIKGFEAMGMAAERQAMREEKARERQWKAAERAAEKAEKIAAKKAAAEAKAAEELALMAERAEMAAKRLGLQGEAAAQAVKIGVAYAQNLRQTGKEQSELMKVWTASLSPAEKTIRNLVMLSAKTDELTLKSHAMAETVSEATLKWEDQYRRQQSNLGGQNKLSRSLSELLDQQRAAITVSGVFSATLQTKMLEALQNTEGMVGRLTARFATFGEGGKFALTAVGTTSLIAAAGVAAVGAGILAAGNHAGPFIKDMRDLENTLGLVGDNSDAARQAMAALQDRALSAASLGIGPREAADAMGQLASLGLNAVDTLKAFEPVALLAKARGLDMGTAAKIAGAQMAIFGTNVNNLGLELDKLSIISNMTGVQASDLQQMMAKAGKGAIAAGQDFNSIAIAAGLARNAGIAMEEVMTGIGSGLLHITGKGRDTFKTLTEGKDIIDATTGKFRPLEAILLDVTKATEGMTAADKSHKIEKIFGREALTAILPVMAQLTNGIKDQTGNTLKGADAAAYMRKQLDEASGANKRFADNIATSLEAQKAKFAATMDALATNIGAKIEPALSAIVSLANDAAGALNRIFSSGESAPITDRIAKLREQIAYFKDFSGAPAEKVKELNVQLVELLRQRTREQNASAASVAVKNADVAATKALEEATKADVAAKKAAVEAQRKLVEGLDEHKKTSEAMASANESQRAALMALVGDGLEPAAKAVREFEQQGMRLNAALDGGLITSEQYSLAMTRLSAAVAQSRGEADKLAPAFRGLTQDAVDYQIEALSFEPVNRWRDAMTDAMDRVKMAWPAISESAVQAMSIIGTASKEVFAPIGDLLSSAVGAGTSLINTVIQQATGMDLWSLLLENGANAGQVLETALAGVDFTAMLSGLADGFVQVLGTLNNPAIWTSILDGVMQAISILGSSAGPMIGELAVTMIEALVDALPVLLPALIEAGVAIAVGIVKAIPVIVTALANAMPTIVVELIKSLIENLPTLIVAIVEAIPIIVKAIVVGVGALLMELIAMALDALGLDKQADSIRGMVEAGTSTTSTTPTSSTWTGTSQTGGATSVNKTATYEVSDAYLGVSGSPRLIRDTPGDVTQSYQAGGPNDPAVHARQGNAIAAAMLGVLQEMLAMMRANRAESTGSTSGARSAGISMRGAAMIA